jgi:DNA-binding CsgD family transcriptional regulator
VAIAHLTDENPDLDLYRRRLHGQLAEMALERGHWDEAATLVDALLAEKRSASLTRMKALTVLGRLRARRGDPDLWSPLEEGLALAGPQADDQDVCPLRAARAEAAWLEGDNTSTRAEAEAGLALQEQWNPWVLGELGFWAWKAGSLPTLPDGSARPYVLHSRGLYREAASAWEAIGCPYQQAFALADSDDEDDLRQALEISHSLGARPMARTVTERLRAIGARSIPRGPRPLTRRNPAQLTAREVEVLALLGDGLRNADIAQRLVVSAKTVDHHVSAILRKLGVSNRAAAVEEAGRLGLKDGEAVTAR